MEEQEYLEPDFDPNSLTVPKLRSILVAHNVNYPSSAKKAELIQHFNDNVVPQARKLRAASLRVKRTSRGIVDVPASQNTDDYEEDEIHLALPPSASAGRRSRGPRARTEEVQEVAPTPRSMRHSTAPPESAPRRASSKHARTVDQEEPIQERETKRAASGKTRLSAQTPVVKREGRDGESPFSAENVFQSGSSPPAEPATDRRRTASSTKDLTKRRSQELRRHTNEVKPVRRQMDGVVVPQRRTFNVPVKHEDEALDPSEEFTPEGQQEIIKAEQSGELVPARPRRSGSVAKSAGNGFLAVLVALLAGFSTLWGQEKFQVGYCGEGHHSTEVAGVEIPDWANVARPVCEPCPPHAKCYPKLRTVCDPDFVLKHHPLSLGGLLPIPPTCEPDTILAQKVETVKQHAVNILREKNADYECGKAKSPVVKEHELKKALSSMRRTRISDEEFNRLWESAIGEVRDADEVVEGTDGSGHFTLRSTSLARVPLLCAVRRSVRETARAYLWQLVTIFLVLGSGSYGYYSLITGRETDAKVKRLANIALDNLSEQAALHAMDPDTYADNYISVAQLRDDVLRSEFSTWRRGKLWDQVQKKVEKNSNVRPMVREGRSGDVGRVWEWTGQVRRIESPPSAWSDRSGYADGGYRRKSGRVSFGGEQWIEPESSPYKGDDGRQEMSQVKKWEEGRPYY